MSGKLRVANMLQGSSRTIQIGEISVLVKPMRRTRRTMAQGGQRIHGRGWTVAHASRTTVGGSGPGGLALRRVSRRKLRLIGREGTSPAPQAAATIQARKEQPQAAATIQPRKELQQPSVRHSSRKGSRKRRRRLQGRRQGRRRKRQRSRTCRRRQLRSRSDSKNVFDSFAHAELSRQICCAQTSKISNKRTLNIFVLTALQVGGFVTPSHRRGASTTPTGARGIVEVMWPQDARMVCATSVAPNSSGVTLAPAT